MSPPRLVHDSADPPQESGGASGPPNGNGLASRVSVLESELKHLATKKDVSEIKVWALTGALWRNGPGRILGNRYLETVFLAASRGRGLTYIIPEAKPSGPKPDPPPNEERKKHYCEGDDDVMAKQGNRDRLNPRHCPSLELDSLTGRRSSDSIRASGNDCAAPKGRIDDCKPNPLLITKTTCNQGGVHR